MNKIIYLAAAGLLISAAGASAADLPARVYTKAAPVEVVNPWDIAFGGAIATDYNFRGVSQSDRSWSPSAYFEPRCNINPNLQIYAGIAGYGVKLPTEPSAEIDLYAGIRPVFGALSLDFGFLYYYYPAETQQFSTGVVLTPVPTAVVWTLNNTDFWEVYGKASYAFNSMFSVGGSVYYSPSWLNSDADGTFASVTAKITGPALANGIGLYASGEYGHYWLGTSNATLGSVDYPDYNTWNLGVGATYKAITLDVRYYDTDLSTAQCSLIGGDPASVASGVSNWCSETVIGKISFDTSLNNLK